MAKAKVNKPEPKKAVIETPKAAPKPVAPVVPPKPIEAPKATSVAPAKPIVTAPVKVVVPPPVVLAPKKGVIVASEQNKKPFVIAMSAGRPVQIGSWKPLPK